jgi:3-oxoacyl-[acyl-carrier protein] reductase
MLKDKIILVTGASHGIGKATALFLAKHGATIIVNYHNSKDEAQTVVDEIIKEGGRAEVIYANVAVEADVKAMFKYIIENYKRLDVIVNNAGLVKNNLLLMTSTSEFDDIMATNCRGVFLCMRAAAKIMTKQKSGKIINISSIVGTNGNRGQVAYSGSKACVIGFTKSAAKELGAFGITVNAIAPGLIDTDRTKELKDDIKKNLISNTSLGRIGIPEDIAHVALFLSSSLSDYVSGEVIGVNGAQVM